MNKSLAEFTDYLVYNRYIDASIKKILLIVKPFTDRDLQAINILDEEIINKYIFAGIDADNFKLYSKGHYIKANLIYFNDFLNFNIKSKEFGIIQYFKKHPYSSTFIILNKIIKKEKHPKCYIYFNLMLDYGLKPDELIHIKVKDIDFVTKKIHVQCKETGFVKYLDLTTDLAKKIKKYIDTKDNSTWLFEHNNGKNNTPRCFEKAFQKILNKTKLSKEATLGVLRDCYGKAQMKDGIDPQYLQNIMSFKNRRSLNVFKQTSNPRIIHVPNILKNKKK